MKGYICKSNISIPSPTWLVHYHFSRKFQIPVYPLHIFHCIKDFTMKAKDIDKIMKLHIPSDIKSVKITKNST